MKQLRIVDENDRDYGIVGDITNITYKDGSFAQVGDVVDVESPYTSGLKAFVCKNRVDINGFVMGVAAAKFSNGSDKKDYWKINLVRKFHEAREFELHGLKIKNIEFKNINVDGQNHLISSEKFDEIYEILE